MNIMTLDCLLQRCWCHTNLKKFSRRLSVSPHCFRSIVFSLTHSFLATMLDIPELDDMICRQLVLHDLAQCALVSKKWHTLVIPYIWRDLSWMTQYCTSTKVRDFFRMVNEDYIAEQQCQDLQGAEQSTQARSILPLSALSRYGRWIRVLPDPYQLSNLQEPLLNQFLHYAPDAQVKYFWMAIEYMDSESPQKAIVDFALPRVQRLRVGVHGTPRSSSISKLMHLLDQPSIALERLELEVTISNMIEDEPMENEPETCTTLRELVFCQYYPDTDTETFLSMLFRRCGRVEKFQLVECIGPVDQLSQGMLSYMPDLKEISLGDEGEDDEPDDAAMATLLSGSRHGWKIVRLRSRLGTEAIDALLKHTSTLELLDIRECDGTLSIHLGQLLSSCTNLHTLAWSLEDHSDSTYCSYIDFKAFIDLDPDTGAPKPWRCEASLKEFKVIITGISRSYLQKGGDGREVQSRVYDRLARFTNLETLWLGDAESSYCSRLEMSLASGLGKLSGFKELRELSVFGLATRIGIEEAQWMSANWPRLYVVRGLGDAGACTWFKENTGVNAQLER